MISAAPNLQHLTHLVYTTFPLISPDMGAHLSQTSSSTDSMNNEDEGSEEDSYGGWFSGALRALGKEMAVLVKSMATKCSKLEYVSIGVPSGVDDADYGLTFRITRRGEVAAEYDSGRLERDELTVVEVSFDFTILYN